MRGRTAALALSAFLLGFAAYFLWNRQSPLPSTREPVLSLEAVAALIPEVVVDREGWAGDVLAGLETNGVAPEPSSVCMVLAIVEQESGFQADPVVAGLENIVTRQLNELEARLGPAGPPLKRSLLQAVAPGQTDSFELRLKSAKTEQDLDRLFRDMLEFHRQKHPGFMKVADAVGDLFVDDGLEGLNPITTAGSMQVSVRYAEEQARARRLDPSAVRDDLYSRRGGLTYGIARLFGYEADYDRPLFRFADYNAGQYASRNAALQVQLAALVGTPLEPDGDFLRYDRRGRNTGETSKTLAAVLELMKEKASDLGEWQVRRDLEKEKDRSFEQTRTYRLIREAYEEKTSSRPAYAAMPRVVLQSPKLSSDRSTAWFAEAVQARYDRCLQASSHLANEWNR